MQDSAPRSMLRRSPDRTSATHRARATFRRSAVATLALSLLGLVALGGTAVAAPTVAAATLAATGGAVAGDPLEVEVALTATEDLYSSQVTLAYDPALLALDDAAVTSPEGGFGQVVTGEGSVTFIYSRLGTSPGISGDVAVGTASFTTLAAGTTSPALTEVTLVGADGGSVSLAADALPSAEVVIAPAPTEEPISPEPTSPEPTSPEPTSPEPTSPEPTSPEPTSPDPTSATSTAPAGGGSGSSGGLASTGVTVTAVGLLALALTAAGVVLARRRTAAAR